MHIKRTKINKTLLLRLALLQSDIKKQTDFAAKIGTTSTILSASVQGLKNRKSKRVIRIVDDFIMEQLGIDANVEEIFIGC